MSSNIYAVILAAGKSTRFGTGQNKQLSVLSGKPMVGHVLDSLNDLAIKFSLIIGHQAELVEKTLGGYKKQGAQFILQKEQNGTGHAVKISESSWDGDHILIINGDMPLITKDIISGLIAEHEKTRSTVTFCVTDREDPSGYGRVIIDHNGISIIEEKECSEAQKKVKTVNAGVYIINRIFLSHALTKLEQSEVTGEMYITDLIFHARQESKKITTYQVDQESVQGVNSLEELACAENILNKRVQKYLMGRGVRFINPESILIDASVSIDSKSIIYPGSCISGNTHIGSSVTVGPYSVIKNSFIGDGCEIKSHSVIENSEINKNVSVGPFAHIRPETKLKDNSVVGNFVEVKKSEIGAGSKVKHLSYIGDSTIGEKANIGAGVITCNYDGFNKHKSIIKDNVSVGANTSLVAPVTLEENSATAAGSVITKDIPEYALGIGRSRQENKSEWVTKHKLQKQKNKTVLVEKQKRSETELSGAKLGTLGTSEHEES